MRGADPHVRQVKRMKKPPKAKSGNFAKEKSRARASSRAASVAPCFF
jgi:hypothetical protein